MNDQSPPAQGAGPELEPDGPLAKQPVLGDWQGIAGALLVAATGAIIVGEFGFHALAGNIAALLVVSFALLQLRRLSFSVLILAAAGFAFLVFGFLTRSDMIPLIESVAVRSAWVVAVFVSLLSLRSAVNDIPGIVRSGLYLVSQPPGRRYAALTLGSQLFSHILQYGAVTLLGGLVTNITGREPEGWLRRARERRMLLAIQRGFIATLCWSPVAFPMIISTAVVPGSDWIGSVPGALGTSVLIMGIGWFLDSLFKPQVPAARPMAVLGAATDLLPLALLLGALFAGAAAIVLTTGMSTSVAVLVMVPLMALVIVLVRAGGSVGHMASAAGGWVDQFARNELPLFSAESMLVIAATFTGLLSVELLGPVIETVALPAMPGWLILAMVVWWMPAAGQVGLHPILAASLVGGLFPQPAQYGLTPDQLVVAITGGWALSGATSPFTAVTALVARLGRVSAYTVGWRWNGLFLLCTGIAVSLWAAFNPVS